MVRDDIRSGELSPGAHDVGDMLAGQPEAPLLIVDLAAAEGRKKRPDEGMYQAYSFMLGQTLEQLRLRSESGQGHATLALDQVRAAIARQTRAGKLLLTTAVALVAAFTCAGIEPGDEVRGALDDAMSRAEFDHPGPAMPDPSEMLRDLADACEGDPFMIQSEFAGMTAAMPVEPQLTLLGALVLSDVAALREAAVGWLLTEPTTAAALAELLEAAAKRGLVSATSITHLMLIRNWVPEEQRGGIDAIIKAARSIGGAVEKHPAIQVRELLISERDGAGAQSLFASIKEGRKHALVSILIKQGHGVRDAWVARSLSRGEVEDMLDQIATGMSVHETTAEDIALILNNALADGCATGSNAPFGLVQAVTLLGLSDVAPRSISLEDLVTSLLADVDAAAVDSKAVTKAVRGSGQWLATNPQLDSWFENGDDVILAIKGKRKIEQRIAAIIDVLEQKRRYWAMVIAWSAFAQRGDDDDMGWIEMALVAREMGSKRPLTELPIARYIAMQTAAAAAS